MHFATSNGVQPALVRLAQSAPWSSNISAAAAFPFRAAKVDASFPSQFTSRQTTQISVIDEFSIFLVLANKELISYSLSSIVPQLPDGRRHPPQRLPHRLSDGSSVEFFAIDKLKVRISVVYKTKSGGTLVCKVMTPVVRKADVTRTNVHSRKKPTTFFPGL
jgi:CNH domain